MGSLGIVIDVFGWFLSGTGVVQGDFRVVLDGSRGFWSGCW